MAIGSTIGQLTVGTSAVRLTTMTGLTGVTDINLKPLVRGVRVYNGGSGKLYWGPSDVTTSTGYQLASPDQIAPNDAALIGDIYLISDTVAQAVSIDVVGQVFA